MGEGYLHDYVYINGRVTIIGAGGGIAIVSYLIGLIQGKRKMNSL